MSNKIEKNAEKSAADFQLDIIKKATDLAILNRISQEIIQNTTEEDLIKEIIKIIIGYVNLDNGSFISINEKNEILKEPLYVSIYEDLKPVISKTEKFKNTPQINKLLDSTLLTVLKYSDLFESAKKHHILFIPLQINPDYKAILIFDNFRSKSAIDTDRFVFFSSAARQLEIALRNFTMVGAVKKILTYLPSSIIILDKKKFNISYINKSFAENFKLVAEKVQNKNFFEVVNISKDAKKQLQKQIMTSSQQLPFDNQEININNSLYGYTIFIMPREIDNRDEIGIIMKNITKNKEMQEQLIRAEKLAALGTLSSGIAHEINNPLYGILATSELIEETCESEEIKELAQNINDFTIHCADIVKDLSSYSRSLKDEAEKDCNIRELIDESLRIISYSPTYRQIQIIKEYKEIPDLFGFAGEIRQILINLFKNAIDAMDGQGTITVNTDFTDDSIVIRIKDTGCGISDENLPNIFDPFYTTKDIQGGTGLGLNIVHRLVSKYKGIINVYSVINEGTQFEIKFPVKTDE